MAAVDLAEYEAASPVVREVYDDNMITRHSDRCGTVTGRTSQTNR